MEVFGRWRPTSCILKLQWFSGFRFRRHFSHICVRAFHSCSAHPRVSIHPSQDLALCIHLELNLEVSFPNLMQIFSRCLFFTWVTKQTLVATLFFSSSQRIVYFFPWSIILKHASTVYYRHGQVIKNIERCLLRNFFVSVRNTRVSTYEILFFRQCETKKFSSKIPDTTLCITFFNTRNFLKKHNKRALLRIFPVTRTFFDIFFFIIPSSMVYRKFRVRQMVNAR